MSSTNRGSPRVNNDAYYTPQNLADALVHKVFTGMPPQRVLEPHVGGGAFRVALNRTGHVVRTNDIDSRVDADTHEDFLAFLPHRNFAWVIGNPPFTGFEAHVDKALQVADRVGFLLRLAAMESASRVGSWRLWPLRHVLVLAERPSFTGQGTDSCAYGFFIFDNSFRGQATVTPGWSWK